MWYCFRSSIDPSQISFGVQTGRQLGGHGLKTWHHPH
jgi:hypothetical protein